MYNYIYLQNLHNTQKYVKQIFFSLSFSIYLFLYSISYSYTDDWLIQRYAVQEEKVGRLVEKVGRLVGGWVRRRAASSEISLVSVGAYLDELP